ncbi:hypothetical protein EV421DRAFT_645581 [Armillaria borealis]|uniref:F-box domain-containing protein n=1 Tax=Armillaria borealis TaxID=47425 RepID=A0AA39MZU9_9AGAR|nr:hypothetical protein EV421DRAFT_645581 [Armillaria borealis]
METVRLSREPNSSIPEIPVEVIEEVLDNLCNDKLTLKSCSLVSRSFYPRTRQYLFQDFFIYHINQEILPRLHDLTLTSPHIFQCPKSAKIYACYQDQTLSQVQFALSSMTNLTKLELVHTTILSLNHLWSIISSFLRLSFLRLYGVAFKLDNDADLSLIKAPLDGPRLETLHVLAAGSRTFLQFILLPQCRGVFIESLRDLYVNLHNPSMEDLSLWCDVIRIARTIESLDVRQAFECPLAQWPAVQPLILPLGLRSFSFDLHYRNSEDRTDLSAMRWFLNALSTSRLETLKLTILVPSFEDFAEEDEMWDMFT